MSDQEREIKFYVQNPGAIADRLRTCGADLARERTHERNLRFDTPSRELSRSGRMLRLRQDDRARVTYKANAHLEDGVTVRTELEFAVDDFSTAHKLLEALGYQVVVAYEKYRQVYRLGAVEVDLDELPFGAFIEIEGPGNDQIKAAARQLGLDWSRGIAASYLGLFEMARTRRNFTFRDLTFENFRALSIKPTDLGVVPADL